MIRILIADDHFVVRRGLRNILCEEYPFVDIVEVEDAESLVQNALQENWDVVISDISMRGRSGLEALAQIKEARPDLPVLILSVYPEEQYALRVLKSGAAGYLNKDMAPEELIRAVRTVVSGRRYITPAAADSLVSSLQRRGDRPAHEQLSDREFEVFQHLATGKAISDIAEKLMLSATTVSTYRSRILTKMQLSSNADIVRYALQNGLF
jgi:two-component system invasion response regulator UvrY